MFVWGKKTPEDISGGNKFKINNTQLHYPFSLQLAVALYRFVHHLVKAGYQSKIFSEN